MHSKHLLMNIHYLWLQFYKIKHGFVPVCSAVERNDLKILITSYPCIFSVRPLSIRQRWLFIHRLFRSPWFFSLPSSYLPFCHLSSPLDAVQVQAEEGKLLRILIAALTNAAVREEWTTIVWHLYHLWISIFRGIHTHY